MRFCNLRTLILFFGFILTAYILFSSNNPGGFRNSPWDVLFFSTPNSKKAHAVRLAFDEWYNCMVPAFEKERSDVAKLWRNFADISNTCIAGTMLSNVKTTELKNMDDVKYYVFPGNISAPSTIVSLGIGADITAELQLKNTLPLESEFFGADPVVQPNSKLFAEVGTFFPFAVSMKSGIIESSLLEDDGSYKEKNAISVDFVIFLRDMVNRTIIDLLLMDNEGPEYDLVPLLAIENIFKKSGITICQVNVEFHAPGPIQRHQSFEKVMSGVLAAKLFVPLRSLYWGHQRIYFFNRDSRYCIEKYLIQFF